MVVWTNVWEDSMLKNLVLKTSCCQFASPNIFISLNIFTQVSLNILSCLLYLAGNSSKGHIPWRCSCKTSCLHVISQFDFASFPFMGHSVVFPLKCRQTFDVYVIDTTSYDFWMSSKCNAASTKKTENYWMSTWRQAGLQLSSQKVQGHQSNTTTHLLGK